MLLCESNCSTSAVQQSSGKSLPLWQRYDGYYRDRCPHPASKLVTSQLRILLLGLKIKENAIDMFMTLNHCFDFLSQELVQVWILNLHLIRGGLKAVLYIPNMAQWLYFDFFKKTCKWNRLLFCFHIQTKETLEKLGKCCIPLYRSLGVCVHYLQKLAHSQVSPVLIRGVYAGPVGPLAMSA